MRLRPEPGALQLEATWRDAGYAPGQRFYYVRILENLTCRWSTRELAAPAGPARGHLGAGLEFADLGAAGLIETGAQDLEPTLRIVRVEDVANVLRDQVEVYRLPPVTRQ